MSRKRRKRPRKPPGAPPGTLVPDADAPKPVIHVIAFGPDGHVEEQITDLSAIPRFLERWPVTWINVDGLGDVPTITKIGQFLGLHPLALEDAVHVNQRPKVDQYDNHLFIVARMAAASAPLETEQLSLFVGRQFVVTFQEGRPGDCFGPLRERLRHGAGPVRAGGADYLAYGLLDAVIDGYFPVLEALGERLEDLEETVLARPGPHIVGQVHAARRDLLTLRRAVWPLREALNVLLRDVSAWLSDDTRLHLRDCYDHTVRIIDFVETYRELGADLMDLYLSSISYRMGEVMKVLTIISTLFIPLTFISSIYGMNFHTDASPLNMPELAWRWGYPAVLIVMAAVCVGMLLYFRRKGWLGAPASPGGGSALDADSPASDRA